MRKIKTSLLLTTLLLSPLGFSQMSYANQDTAVAYPINQQLIDENGSISRNAQLLTLRWKDMPAKGKVAIKWQDLASGKSQDLKAEIKNGVVTISDPNPNRRTVFKLPTTGKNMISLAERGVPAAGMDNLRDMGGYKTTDGRHTKWGLMYRADTLYKLKPEGYKYVENMNMGHVFDLRNEGEVSKKPDPSIDGVTYYHVQIPDLPPQYKDVSWDTNETIFAFVSSPRAEKFYIDTNAYMVTQPKSHDSLKRIFNAALQGDGKGMVWHCAGGKDRTGFVSAVFLAALDVPEETIINDYLLTNEYRKEFDEKELADMTKTFKGNKQAIKGFLAIQQSRPEFIKAGLDEITSKYGSVANYLEKEVGISKQQIAQLKALYTE